MQALIAWRGGIFLTSGKIGVLSVSSLFLTRVVVYVPGVGMRHFESRKNTDRLKRSIHVDHIAVQSTFIYIYAGVRGLLIWAHCLFFF